MKYITGFFAFWYDFLVGDAWEVAVGVLATLAVIFLLTHYAGGAAATFGVILLPLAVLLLLGFSLWRVRSTR